VVVSDPVGANDLNNVFVLFNSTPHWPAACAVDYNVAANTITLANDAGTGYLQGIPPGSNEQVSNSQCTLTGSGTSSIMAGNTLTLNVTLTFSGTFTGAKNAYVFLQGYDGLDSGGWQPVGTWTP
jgi:hypothetical protein